MEGNLVVDTQIYGSLVVGDTKMGGKLVIGDTIKVHLFAGDPKMECNFIVWDA